MSLDRKCGLEQRKFSRSYLQFEQMEPWETVEGWVVRIKFLCLTGHWYMNNIIMWDFFMFEVICKGIQTSKKSNGHLLSFSGFIVCSLHNNDGCYKLDNRYLEFLQVSRIWNCPRRCWILFFMSQAFSYFVDLRLGTQFEGLRISKITCLCKCHTNVRLGFLAFSGIIRGKML